MSKTYSAYKWQSGMPVIESSAQYIESAQMDNDLIERLARDAGFDVVLDAETGECVGVYATGAAADVEDIRPKLRRMVEMATEECAKVCDETFVEPGDMHVSRCTEAAAAIRAKFKERDDG